MVVISVAGVVAEVHATNVENKDILPENAHQLKIITEIKVYQQCIYTASISGVTMEIVQ